ncbi:MAG: caspase family protein [Lewinellaceae bacterium]|nr:caspase family protein [Lewinellaceae bacterium]
MQDNTKSIGANHAAAETTRPPGGKHYVFAIGINEYRYCPVLENAVNDVQAIVRTLTTRYQFDDTTVKFLLDAQATRRNIHQYFRHLAQTVTEQDSVLVLFSGHGTYDQVLDKGYWVPVDGHPDDTGSFIANIEIIGFLESIRSLHTLVISDSCFSGKLFGRTRFLPRENLLENTPSRWMMTSGRGELVPDKSKFAESLLNFLNKNSEPVVRVSRIFEAIYDAVVNNSWQTPRYEPLQNVGHEGGEFLLRLKGYGPAILPPPPPAAGIPEPLKAIGWWHRHALQLGLAAASVLLAFLIFAWPEIFPAGKTAQPQPATLVAGETALFLSDADSGSVQPFQFTLRNTGNTVAYLDSLLTDCRAIRLRHALPDTLAGGAYRVIHAEWLAGAPGEHSCRVTAAGRNLAQPPTVSVRIRVRPLVATVPQPPAGATPADNRPAGSTRPSGGVANPVDRTPDDVTNAEPPPPQYIDIRTQIPTSVTMYLVVENTNERIDAVARNGYQVFKVPATLRGATVRVYFERGDKKDSRRLRLGRDELFLPQSMNE